VERFGKFNRIVRPGLQILIPFAERAYIVDLQVKQAQFSVETKTRDNVFVQIPVSVQFQVLDDRIFDAFYKLSSPQKQIESFVFNSILGHVPKLTLDETFEQQSGISVAVKTELDSIMSGFGFNILTALVTDIIPDVKVKAAMNDINAAQRAQVAAQARGEAEKVLKVKQAEAEAASKALQGQGIAAERQAIIDGLRSSIEHFREAVPGAPDAVLRHPEGYWHARWYQYVVSTQQSRGSERLSDADSGRAAWRRAWRYSSCSATTDRCRSNSGKLIDL
jgi:regulator of protease activity HflC (stomatin/prohibitin superfamily)